MEDEQGGQDLGSPSNEKTLTFSEYADEMCAVYMSMGVPYHEFWYGDYTQLAYYQKAYELKLKQANHGAWIQGAYVYDAMCMVAPILHAFAKKGTKPTPYFDKPYDMVSNNANSEDAAGNKLKLEKDIQEIQAINASAKFASFMTNWNKQFDNESGEPDERND